MTVWICYCHALEKGCLILRLPVTNILARKRRSPEAESSLPSPLVDLSWNGSDTESADDDAEYINFYGEGNEPIEEEVQLLHIYFTSHAWSET